VEQLDPKTGKIIGLFKNLEEAIARTCPEQQGLSDLGHAVLGYRVAGGKFMGHIFQDVFWRWTGSAASPSDPPPDFPEATYGKHFINYDPHCPQLSSTVMKSALDPFVAVQIKSGRSLKMIVKENPMEQLDPKTGKIVGIFKNLEEAIARTGPEQQGLRDLENAVLGYRVAEGRFMGHMFQGFFWRFKGSVTSPTGPPPGVSPPLDAPNTTNSKASSAGCTVVHHKTTSTTKDSLRFVTAPTAPNPSFTEVTPSTTLRAAVHPSTTTHTSNNEPDEDGPNAPVTCAVHDHGGRGDDKNSTLDATADVAVRHGEEAEEDDWYADV
jgi:hypothetical protein